MALVGVLLDKFDPDVTLNLQLSIRQVINVKNRHFPIWAQRPQDPCAFDLSCVWKMARCRALH